MEFVVDVEEPLRESAKFTAGLLFHLGLEQVEKVAGSGDTLANGSEVNSRGGSTRRKWQLGDGVEGGRALTSTVKFTLEIELNHWVVRYRVCKSLAKREAVKNSESDIDVFAKKPNHSGG